MRIEPVVRHPALRGRARRSALGIAAALAFTLTIAGSETGTPARAAEPSAAETVAPLAVPEALAEAERLIAAGLPVVAFAVLFQTMEALPEGADDAPLRFGIAQALMAGGRLAQAERVLARLEEEQPDNLRVRLDRAAVLFALGRDDDSEALFREARHQPDLPPEGRRKVEEFLAAILARQRLRVDVDLGLWYDGNVNNAAEVGTVTIPAFGNLEFELDEQPVEAWVARTGARLHWREPVTDDGRVLLETNASAARNTAIGASEHNRTWLTLSTGLRISFAVPFAGRRRPGRLAADLGVERRWWGGRGYASNLWGGIGVDQALDADWRLGILPRLWLTGYDGQPGEVDPTGRSLALSVSRRVGPGWLTLGGTLARESAGRSSQNWRSHGLSVTYAADVGEDWSGSVRLGLSTARFDEADPAFLRRREDRTQSVGLSLSHRRLSWRGYQPVLLLDWSRTDSNVPLYDRDLLTFRLGLRRLF